MIWKRHVARMVVAGLLGGVALAAVGSVAWGQERPRVQRDHPLVRQVQTALKEKGFDPGPVDGMMGPTTREALRRFQESNGLTANGQMTDETLDKLGVEIPEPDSDDRRERGFLGDAASAVSSGAKTAASATAAGATTAAKATAKGATTAAKGAATGGKAAGEGAAVAGKATGSAAAKAGEATADAGQTAGGAVVSGAKTAGSAVGSAAGATKNFLFGSDEEKQLEKDVRAALEKDRRVDASHIDIDVDGQNVTLKFKGGTSAEWNRAVVVAKRVKGVQRVFVRTP